MGQRRIRAGPNPVHILAWIALAVIFWCTIMLVVGMIVDIVTTR